MVLYVVVASTLAILAAYFLWKDSHNGHEVGRNEFAAVAIASALWPVTLLVLAYMYLTNEI
jgi:hypothetical protein